MRAAQILMRGARFAPRIAGITRDIAHIRISGYFLWREW